MPDEDGYLGRAVKSFEKIALRAISTGNFGWLAVTIIIVVSIYKLESPDLKEVILKAIPTIGLLGYPVSVISVIVCVRTLRWREQFCTSQRWTVWPRRVMLQFRHGWNCRWNLLLRKNRGNENYI